MKTTIFGTNQSKLSLFDLIRQDNDSIFNGNILINRLKNNEPLYTSLTRKVEILNPLEVINNIVDSKGRYSPYKASKFFKKNNRYIPVFQTKDNCLKLNNIYRTRTFGSNGGSSMGTVGSRLNESIQALFFSLRQYKGERLTEKDYDNIFQYENNTTKINENLISNLRIPVLLNEYIMYDFSNWFYTHTQIANELFDNLDNSKNYIIYHSFYGDGLSSTIHRKYQELIKLEGITFKVSINRWNPSDLYLVSSTNEEKITSDISKCNTLNELNIIMDQYFDSKDLIGISSKKIPKNSKISLVISNDELPSFKYVNSTMSEDPFESMTIYVNTISDFGLNSTQKEKLEVRIFSGIKESNIFMEIKGKTGKYGKINTKYLNYILGKMDLEKLPHFTELQSFTHEELITKIDKMYQELENNTEYTSSYKSSSIIEHRSKLISKYQSLLFISMLENNKNIDNGNGQSISDTILNKIFYYGYSLNNDFFNTCKCYRVKIS